MLAFAGRLSCVMIFVLLIWVQSPGSRVFSPRNVRLKFSISLLFGKLEHFALLDESESDSHCIWDQRLQNSQLCSGAWGINILSPSFRTDFLVRSVLKISFKFVCVQYSPFAFVCRLVPEIQVWKHVQLLDLVKLTGQGGLGLWGYWGPSNLFPNSQKVKSARTCFRTSSTPSSTTHSTLGRLWSWWRRWSSGRRRMPSPSHLGTNYRRIERIELSVRNAPLSWIDYCNFCESNPTFD